MFVVDFFQRFFQNDRHLFGYIIIKAVFVIIMLAILWALEDKDTVVIYMGF